MSEILLELTKILEARKNADPAASYVASLYAGGIGPILKKIGEEATELVMAGKEQDKAAVVHETADLWFHSLILLAHLDADAEDVLSELTRRFGRSGLEEKAGRNK